MDYLSVSNKHKCPTCYLQSVPLLGSLRRVGHFRDTNLSGNGFSVSCDVWGEGMKKPSETSFQRVCLDFVLLLLWTLSGKRDSNSRPQPWQGCALPTELFPQERMVSHCECKGNKNLISSKIFPQNISLFSGLRFGRPLPDAIRNCDRRYLRLRCPVTKKVDNPVNTS